MFKKKLTKKIFSLILALILFLQSESPLFAEMLSLPLNSEQLEKAEQSLSVIDDLYLRQGYADEHEAALNNAFEGAKKVLTNSAAAKKITSLKAAGQRKYGQLWPMYVESSAPKELNTLEEALNLFLVEYASEPKAMPYETFLPEYETLISKTAEEFRASKDCNAECKKNPQKILQAFKADYPARTAYSAYKDFVAKERSWRLANKAKIADYSKNLVQLYVSSFGAEVFSSQTFSLLLNLKFNAGAVISSAAVKSVYDYNVIRLEKQDLGLLSAGVFSDNSKRKAAKVLLSSLTESIIMGALASPSADARYAKAVENIIYRSEKTDAFAYILSAGFSSLVAKKSYAAADRVLAHYNDKENKGSSWYEYLSVRHIADALKNYGGNYLGKASELAQYTSSHSYLNAFSDIARVLAEDNSAASKKILSKYAFDKDIDKTIKPFLAGALLYSDASHSDKALALANINFGDINAIQEYDLDKALSLKYPSLKSKFNSNALITDAALKAKQKNNKNYGYAARAADSADILLAIWGAVSLFKLGAQGVGLAKSAYLAVKASNIAEEGARIAYIKANYAKMLPYISAKKSLAHLGLRIKSTFGKGINIQKYIKMQNELNSARLTQLAQARDAAVKAAESGKPADAARAAYLQAGYLNQQAKISLIRDFRTESGQTLLSKYTAYKNGFSAVVGENPFTAGEYRVLGSAANYAGSVRDMNLAFNQYYPYMNFWQKGQLFMYDKFYSWLNALRSTSGGYRTGASYAAYTDIGSAAGGSELRLMPALSQSKFSLYGVPYAYADEAVAVAGRKKFIPPLAALSKSKKAPVLASPFLPVKPRALFNPEEASFKIVSLGEQSQVGSGYYIRRGRLNVPLIFTASHVIGDANVVQIRDINGNYTKGSVININKSSGYDLAAIFVDDPHFLSGRVPFTLGTQTPAVGSLLTAHSYPDGAYYRTSVIHMLDNNYLHPSYKYPSFLTTSGGIVPGSSGGVVSLGDFDGTAVGTVMSGIDDKVLLVPLNTMREFFDASVRKLLFEPALSSKIAASMPGFSNFYFNLMRRKGIVIPIAAYDAARSVAAVSPAVLKPVISVPESSVIGQLPAAAKADIAPESGKPLSFIKMPKLFSAQRVGVRDILNSSVFRVESGRHYGTGAYINYHGFDAILTAGHILADGSAPATIIAPSGLKTKAEVFAYSGSGGYDLALLLPSSQSFFAGYRPLNLAYQEPQIGVPMFSAGWQGHLFTFKDHKLLHDRFRLYASEGSSKPITNISYSQGFFAISDVTGKGNSGAPFIADDGRLYGLSNSILPNRDLNLAIRYNVIKDFMRETLKQKFMDPSFDLEAFKLRFPALASNYANVMSRYSAFSGSAVLAAEKAKASAGITPMSEGAKNFRFWLGTKIFRLSPKSVLSKLYLKGASPRVYIPLYHTGEEFILPSLEPYKAAPRALSDYPVFPFTNIKMYTHRGMSLSQSDILNIMDNGLRKADMPEQNLSILAPQMTAGTKLQAISLSPYAVVSARYAASNLGAQRPFPVMVDVTGVNKTNALVNVHGMFTSRDIPPENIARYSILLNIGGAERWGELSRLPSGGFSFKPYKTDVYVPPFTNAYSFMKEGFNLAGITLPVETAGTPAPAVAASVSAKSASAFAPIESAVSAQLVSGALSYEISVQESAKYIPSYEEAMRVQHGIMTDAFYENMPYYYRGTTMTLDEVVYTVKKGMYSDENASLNIMEKKLSAEKENISLLFTQTPGISAAYACANLKPRPQAVPVIFKVNPFKIEYSNGVNFLTSESFSPSDIKGVAALLKVDGVPAWGEISVTGGKIIFEPYIDTSGIARYTWQ